MTDAELEEGRALVRTNLWRIFWVSAIVAWLGSRSAGNLAWLRLVAIALACLLAYRGLRWGLWLLGVLTVFAGAMMIGLALTVPGLEWTDRVLLAGGGMVQVLAFLILLNAPEVRAFMEHQRRAHGSVPR